MKSLNGRLAKIEREAAPQIREVVERQRIEEEAERLENERYPAKCSFMRANFPEISAARSEAIESSLDEDEEFDESLLTPEGKRAVDLWDKIAALIPGDVLDEINHRYFCDLVRLPYDAPPEQLRTASDHVQANLALSAELGKPCETCAWASVDSAEQRAACDACEVTKKFEEARASGKFWNFRAHMEGEL